MALGTMSNYVIHVPVTVVTMLIMPIFMWISLLSKGGCLLTTRLTRILGIVPEVGVENIFICCSSLAVCGYVASLPYFAHGMACTIVYLLAVELSGHTVSDDSASYNTHAISLTLVLLMLTAVQKYMILMYTSGVFIYMYYMYISKETPIATDNVTEPPPDSPSDGVQRNNEQSMLFSSDDKLPENMTVNVSPRVESANTATIAGIISGGVGNTFDMKDNDISGSFDPQSFGDICMPSRPRGGVKEDCSFNYDSKSMTGQVTAERITGNVMTTTEVKDNKIITKVENSTVSGSLLEDLKRKVTDEGKDCAQGVNINIVNSGNEKNEEENNEMKKLIEMVSGLQSKFESMTTHNESSVSQIQEIRKETANMNGMLEQMRTDQNGSKDDAESKFEMKELKRELQALHANVVESMTTHNESSVFQIQEIRKEMANMNGMLEQMRTDQNGSKDDAESKFEMKELKRELQALHANVVESMTTHNESSVFQIQEIRKEMANMNGMLEQMRTDRNGSKDDAESKFEMKELKRELHALTNANVAALERGLDADQRKLGRLGDFPDILNKLQDQERRTAEVIATLKEMRNETQTLYTENRGGNVHHCCHYRGGCPHQ